MKNLKGITLLFLGLVLIGCSSDDDSGTPGTLSGNYFPSTMGDLWNFDVENRNPDDATFDFDATDLLTVNAGTSSSFTVEANGGLSPATGNMNAFLTTPGATLERTEDMLLFTGDLELPPAFSAFSDATIPLAGVALYDLNAAIGELSNTPGTINQDLDLEGTIIPLEINYAFTTSKLTSATNTLTVNGTTYDNVMKGNLSLEVTVIGTMPVLGATTILDTQDVLSIDYYFAADIGLIQANAVQGYEVAATFVTILEGFGITLDLPTSIAVTNDQEITSFVVD